MAVLADSLPDDAGTLKVMLIAERIQNERLRQIIKELQRHRFGRRAETLPEDQMLLGLEEVEQVAAGNEAQIETANPAEQASRATKRRMNRGSLPAHLPRIEMVVDIESHTRPCCGNASHRIGEDTGERLDIVPAQFRVLVVRPPKYGCRSCENVVVQAAAPARLIEGGLPTEGSNMPITFRFIGRPRSTLDRASNSTARHWPIGSGVPPSCCDRFMSGC
jgi:transposase